MPALEQVARKYDDVDIWHMYVREPHAGDRKFKHYDNHKDYDHRLKYAVEMRGQLDITTPVVLDNMDEKVHLAYGNMPNMVYVIDKTGKVVYKANWTDTPVVDHVLEELHAEAKVS